MTASRKQRAGGPSRPRAIGANDNGAPVANDYDGPIPILILIGDLPVVSRRTLDKLTPGEISRVNRIEAAVRGRRKGEAAKLALEFERSLGITTAERIAAMKPANDTDSAIEAAIGLAFLDYAERYVPPPPPKRAKKHKDGRKAKPPVVDPLEGLIPGDLTQDEIDRLKVADADITSLDADKRDDAKRTIDRIQAAAKARALGASMTAARAELEALERLRDPEVQLIPSPRKEHKGRVELSNRDGLESLWISGHLDDRQRASGRRYRDAYERADDPIQSNAQALYRRMMSAGGGSKPAGPGENDAWDAVRSMEGRVCRSTASVTERGRRLLCIREVAGKGHTIRAVSGGGKAHQNHMLSLKAALDAIS